MPLRDDQWESIKDLLPGREGHVGVCRGGTVPISRRHSLAGPAGTLRRSDKGSHTVLPLGESEVWKKVFEVLAADADNEYAMIDSTIVRAHQHSAGAQKKTAKTRQSGAARAD